MNISKPDISRITQYTRPESMKSRRITVNNNSKINRGDRAAVTFKGLSPFLYKAAGEATPEYKKILKIASRELGDAADNLFKDIKKLGAEGKTFNFVGDNNDGIQFYERSTFTNFVKSATFPVTRLPFLLADSVLNGLKHIGPLKKTAERLYDSPALSKVRNDDKMYDLANRFQGLLQSTKKLVDKSGQSVDEILANDKNPKSVSDGLFDLESGFFDPKTGNYNTVHERTLNRIVTGLIPATFLGADAYNLSIMCGDSKDVAEKEKKTREKQEVSRIFTNAYISLISLGALQKYVNKSAGLSAAISAGTVLVAETLGRWINGRPVTFVSKEKAIEINKKEQEKAQKASGKTNAQSFKAEANPKTSQKDSASVSVSDSAPKTESAEPKVQNNKKDQQKPLITFKTLKSAVGGILTVGLSLSYLRNSRKLDGYIEQAFPDAYGKIAKKLGKDPGKEAVFIKGHMDQFLNYFKTNLYERFMTKEYKLKIKDYKAILKKLDDSGNKELADKYREIAAPIGGDDDYVKLLSKNKFANWETNPREMTQARVDKRSRPFLDIFVYPFKFVWSAIRLPFKITRSALNMPASMLQTKIAKYAENAEQNKNISVKQYVLKPSEQKIKAFSEELFGPAKDDKKGGDNVKSFIHGMNKLSDKLNMSNEEFKKYVDSALTYKFSPLQSKYSNTELANLTKVTSSAITSAFLVADNYNMVMIKSKGENKDESQLRAKERVVQRVSSMFYQTMLMNWFNTTFQKLYHSALMGMSVVSSFNTVGTEIFTRKSIGMPTQPKSYDELVDIDEKNNSRKDFLGSYFRFMSRLTGKKPLERKQPKEAPVNQSNPVSMQIPSVQQNVSPQKTRITNLVDLYTSKN